MEDGLRSMEGAPGGQQQCSIMSAATPQRERQRVESGTITTPGAQEWCAGQAALVAPVSVVSTDIAMHHHTLLCERLGALGALPSQTVFETRRPDGGQRKMNFFFLFVSATHTFPLSTHQRTYSKQIYGDSIEGGC